MAIAAETSTVAASRTLIGSVAVARPIFSFHAQNFGTEWDAAGSSPIRYSKLTVLGCNITSGYETNLLPALFGVLFGALFLE